MQHIFPSAFIATAMLSATAYSATSYFEDFSGFGTNPSDLHGDHGWTVNDTSATFLAFNTARNLQNFGGNPADKAGGIGGAYDVGSVATISVKKDFTAETGSAFQLGNITYRVAFTMFDITDTGEFFDRDAFSIDLSDGTGNIFSIIFEPQGQAANLAAALAENDSKWNASYDYATNTGGTIALDMIIAQSGLYYLTLEFAQNGANTDFTLVTNDSVAGSVSDSGTLGLLSSTSVSEVGFSHTPLGGVGEAGENYLAFDNINIVPEPSSLMLLGLTGLGFAFRRVRG